MVNREKRSANEHWIGGVQPNARADKERSIAVIDEIYQVILFRYIKRLVEAEI